MYPRALIFAGSFSPMKVDIVRGDVVQSQDDRRPVGLSGGSFGVPAG